MLPEFECKGAKLGSPSYTREQLVEFIEPNTTIMNWFNRTRYHFGKLMSDKPWKQIRWIVYILLFIIVAIGLITIFVIKPSCGIFCRDYCAFSWKEDFWNALISFFSPVPIYNSGHKFLRFLAFLTGTIFFSGVIIAFITNFIRTAGERFLNGTAGYKFKGHVLFLGYDEMMIGTLRQELKKDDDQKKKTDYVIAVPNDAAGVRNAIYQHLRHGQMQHVFVVQASLINTEDLKSIAHVHAAKKIFIIGQPDEPTHDAINLKCLGLIAAINPLTKAGLPVPCYYYLRNQATFFMIHRIALQAEIFRKDIEAAKMTFCGDTVEKFIKASEPFNFHESIARHILFQSEEHDTDTLHINFAKGNPHLVIYGMTPMGIALMRDVLMTQHLQGRRLKITMVDDNAQEEMHYLIGRHRPFFEKCHYTFKDLDDEGKDFDHPAVLDYLDVDVEFIQGNVANQRMSEYIREWVKDKTEPLAIAICTRESPKNMALALYMPREVFEAKIPIWVYQDGDNSMNSFVETEDKNNLYNSICIFSTLEYGIADRRTSLQWQLAKAVGDGYARRHPDGKEYQWEYSQPKNRWSSLYGAISKIAMLRNIGKDHPPILLEKSDKERLAISEHDRWNTEKLLNGWEPTTLPNERTLFKHYNIVSSEALDDETKKKDIEQIEDVVDFLKKEGQKKSKV